MITTNYHIHTAFCDGKGLPRDYAEAALSAGLTDIGFSAHAPLPFENDWTLHLKDIPAYFDGVKSLRTEYEGKLQIRLGLEIDFLDGIMGPADQVYRDMDLDFTIGSVHMLMNPEDGKGYSVDGPIDELYHLKDVIFQGDFFKLSREFYRAAGRMAEKGGFSFAGHLDLIKKNNRGDRFFREDDPRYRGPLLDLLDVLQQTGTVIEVNTGGMSRGYTDTVYPSPWVLRECRMRNIPITLNGDTHSPSAISFGYDIALDVMKNAGYREYLRLSDNRWREEPLPGV